MKRIICLILSVLMVFSLSSCGKKNKDNKQNTVDIEYHAKLGVIPECEYKLGDNVTDMEETFQKKYDEDEHFQYNKMEGKTSIRLSLGTQFFYYLKDKKDKGVSYIVTFEKAYGFDLGTLKVELEKALEGHDYVTEELNSDNGFFMLGQPSGEVISCEFYNNTVVFVFVDNALCATALFNTNDW